jgi:hypothetical protein
MGLGAQGSQSRPGRKRAPGNQRRGGAYLSAVVTAEEHALLTLFERA